MLLNKIIDSMNIKEGDILLVTGDTKKLIEVSISQNKNMKRKLIIDLFINQIIARIGESGTLLFPTFNWDFCKGITYDINSSLSQTCTLSATALQMCDFIRTNHPIYSFATTGKHQDYLKSINNINSFDETSPFAFLFNHQAKMISIDTPLQECFSYFHYVEEAIKVPYKHNKSFTANYVDDDGNSEQRTYKMYVKNLASNIKTNLEPLENIFKEKNIMQHNVVDDIDVRVIDLYNAYYEILDDIKNNEGKNIYTKERF